MNAQRTVQIIRPSSELSTEDQKIKAAAYCRVSTDSDDQENSFLAQVKYYSDYIGSRDRRKVQNDVVYWVCSRKRISGFDCDSPNLTEEAVKKGFVKAYNKLRTFEKEILDKTIADLSELHNKRTRGNAEINQIDTEIMRLSEQNSRFENFRSNGWLLGVSNNRRKIRRESYERGNYYLWNWYW